MMENCAAIRQLFLQFSSYQLVPRLVYQNMLGRVYSDIAQYQKAIEYYELALASDLKTYGEDHPMVAIRRNNLGKAWNSLGQHQKAIGYYELALPTLIDKLGPDHPNSVLGSNNLEVAREALADKNQ
ncbi:MAG TPA: tetratricopeptide repeat protein [Nitrosomonas sp.]|jgi:tetratricopeptide (TPR) repeat protein|nr:tetratricopeptide repeat protein [Nitrosomonas sp.]HRB98406.1 tetratricopeptide repeat protein [Nitrosomonas sp.]